MVTCPWCGIRREAVGYPMHPTPMRLGRIEAAAFILDFVRSR